MDGVRSALPDADAERSAAQARDVRVQAAWFRRLGRRTVLPAERAVSGPCTPAAVRFAEQSCAAPAKAARPDAPQPERAAHLQKSLVPEAKEAQALPAEGPRGEPAVLQLAERQASRLEVPLRDAQKQPAAQPR